MNESKHGYLLIETMIALIIMTIIIKALFGLASHMVALRINIDQRIKKQQPRAHQQHFSFVQQHVPKEQVGFTAHIVSPCSTGGGL